MLNNMVFFSLLSFLINRKIIVFGVMLHPMNLTQLFFVREEGWEMEERFLARLLVQWVSLWATSKHISTIFLLVQMNCVSFFRISSLENSQVIPFFISKHCRLKSAGKCTHALYNTYSRVVLEKCYHKAHLNFSFDTVTLLNNEGKLLFSVM